MTPLTVRRASTFDVPVVASLLDEATAWLTALGSGQWQYPPRIERIIAGVQSGTVWMAKHDQCTVGTITVDNFADPEFWMPTDDPDDALYVHRTVVTRAAAGQRIGAALFNWASLNAEASGHTWLRLDAWATNTQLHSYYLAQGWTHIRTLRLSHRGSGALFQRRAGTTTPEAPKITEVQ
ncbi:MAG: hypothetical protein QG671_4047 [Actinomycetota bacterium]|nr:hypothetical protein [Actinomycetota bacterium]